MKNRKRRPRFRKSTTLLLAAALILLAGSAIGSTRAALTYFSDNYYATMNTPEIGVALVENGKTVARDDGEEGELLTHFAETDVQLGKEYVEELAVQNTGDIPQYVRVQIYKSWIDPQGAKDTALSPSYIELNTLPENGWIEDESARTTERSVWYYSSPVKAGEPTKLLSDTIRIGDELASKVHQETSTEGGQTVTTTVYAYDGYTFQLTAKVDAVQNHNAADAIKSAWGVDVTMSGDTITGVR